MVWTLETRGRWVVINNAPRRTYAVDTDTRHIHRDISGTLSCCVSNCPSARMRYVVAYTSCWTIHRPHRSWVPRRRRRLRSWPLALEDLPFVNSPGYRKTGCLGLGSSPNILSNRLYLFFFKKKRSSTLLKSKIISLQVVVTNKDTRQF